MRVAFSSIYDSLSDRFNKLNYLQQTTILQLSSGQRIVRPGDDPAATKRILENRTTKSEEQQFWRNAGDAKDIALASESDLRELYKIFTRVQELTTRGTSGINDPQTFYALQSEANQLAEQALGLANRRLNNVYLHGGTKTDVPPFDDIRDSQGNLLSVNYVGNNNNAPARISESTTVDPRTTGTENQMIANIINNIIAARDAFAAQSPAQAQTVRSQQEALENDLVSSIARLGGVQYRIEVAMRQSTDRFETLETLISRDADIDYAEASVRLTRAQLAYQASIQSGARIMNNSLLDYIR